MASALNIAQTGLDAQQTRLSIISNNLANVATTGFKKSRPNFEDLLYETVTQPGASSSQNTELPSGLMLGTGVRTVSTAKIFTQGTLNQTENTLDVAIQGRGFLQVLMPDGSRTEEEVADYAVALTLAAGLRIFYTTPIKALSNQKYTDLVHR